MTSTIQQILTKACRDLASVSETARLDSEILLAHSLSRSRPYLHTCPDKELTHDELQRFNSLLAQRMKGEPIAHIIGQQAFWSMDLIVTPATLIPRPETERVVELALERIPQQAELQLLDLGTGCGAIALALAKERPRCHITATDQSRLALDVTRQNATRHRLTNLSFIEGDWLTPFSKGVRFDLIVSNPPYVIATDPHLLQGDVRFEPRTALAAGPDGLDDIRKLILQAKAHLQPGGWLLLEHGYDQRLKIMSLLQTQGYVNIEDYTDYAGIPRVVVAQFGASNIN